MKFKVNDYCRLFLRNSRFSGKLGIVKGYNYVQSFCNYVIEIEGETMEYWDGFLIPIINLPEYFKELI